MAMVYFVLALTPLALFFSGVSADESPPALVPKNAAYYVFELGYREVKHSKASELDCETKF